MGKRTTVCIIGVMLMQMPAGPARVLARSMSAADAGVAVKGWLADDPAPLGVALGRAIAGVDTFQDKNGRPMYHVVHIDPLGVVVVPAEDTAEPILAFAEIGTFDASPANPLAALIRHESRPPA